MSRMRVLAWSLFIIFSLWNSIACLSLYTTGDITNLCISADQEENLPQGETETDPGAETYFHDLTGLRELGGQTNSKKDKQCSVEHDKNFYNLLALTSFFTPPEA